MSQTLIEAAKAPTLAFGDKDWDAVRAALSDDHVYDEVATHRKVQGVDQVIQLWRGWATAFPDSRAEIHAALAGGSTVAMEMTWTGTHRGPLPTPGGTVPATGKSINVRACQLVEVIGGKARSTRHYFDMATLLTQLGVGVEQAAKAR